jgi:hypothetical protein
MLNSSIDCGYAETAVRLRPFGATARQPSRVGDFTLPPGIFQAELVTVARWRVE